MKTLLERSHRFLDRPLEPPPRRLLLAAVLLLLPAYLLPLWKMTLQTPGRPEGARLEVYADRLEGGNGGRDLQEINQVNQSIGMRELEASEIAEFQWMPFVLGALALLFLRATLLGKMGTLIDLFVLYLYFGLFAFWSFGHKLYSYGHALSPTASARVEPFMPPLFGHKRIAAFDVVSTPAAGSYALVAVAIVLAAAIFLAWREGRSDDAHEARVVAG